MTLYIASLSLFKAGFEIMILLPWPPESRVYRHSSWELALVLLMKVEDDLGPGVHFFHHVGLRN